MTSITAMKKRLIQLDAEKTAILAKVSTTARKNSDARKYALGGALIKIAMHDARALDVLKQAWAIAKKDKPRAFEDASIPIESNSVDDALKLVKNIT
ncbi:MAG: hypothetical protein L0H10_03550 [Comamonas sp.]|uniref:hypothetical protein n=1 Tax=Comamonas sp. TaxID=34028 RepID=UPI002647BABF|nr:hypothetical protein [Comamonas sp.]MDN5502887.1 hypothetical protein [Comamonas sp.]MDN5537932.1 hypothetical protein [Comamonas sp.]